MLPFAAINVILIFQAFDKFYSWFPSFLDIFPDEEIIFFHYLLHFNFAELFLGVTKFFLKTSFKEAVSPDFNSALCNRLKNYCVYCSKTQLLIMCNSSRDGDTVFSFCFESINYQSSTTILD